MRGKIGWRGGRVQLRAGGGWPESCRILLLWAAGIAAVTYLFYQSFIVSAASVCLAGPAVAFHKRRAQEQRRRELLYQFRDLLYSLSGSIATGRQMGEALREAEENMKLIYGEGEPIREELAYMSRQLRESNLSDEEVWQDFARRSGLEDVQSFADIYAICRHTGGNLERVVMKAAEVLVEKIGIYRELHVLTAQKQWEARVLTGIPLVALLFLQLSSPDYMAVMYETLVGRLLMSLALAAIAGAYLWSRKLTAIEV